MPTTVRRSASPVRRAARLLVLAALLIPSTPRLLAAGPDPERDASFADPAPETPVLEVLVTILPHRGLVERLGGEAVRVHVLVGPNQSPETYQPSPQELLAKSQARLWFTTGTPVESALKPRLLSILPGLEIVPTHLEVEALLDHHCTHHDHDHGELDPHVWVSARNTARQAAAMAASLQLHLPGQAGRIAAALEALETELADLDRELADLLEPVTGRAFFVFHPAFGYFARDYGLRQEAVESGGTAPSPRRLADLMRSIRDQGATTIYVQPQQSVQTVGPLARQAGLAVAVLDPLDPDHLTNLRRIGEALRADLQARP